MSHGAQAQRITLATGWLQLARDELHEARASLEAAVPTSQHGGSARIALWARAWLARAQFRTGRWDEALQTVAAGRELAASTGIVLTVPLLEWTATQVHALRGDAEAADEAVRRAEAAPAEYAVMRIPTLLARAAVAESRADHDGVLRALEPLSTAPLRAAVREPGYWPWVELQATALVSLGRTDEADALLAPHEERVRAGRHRSATARLARARGRWLVATGDLPAARAMFESALAELGELPLRVERAHLLFAYGQVLRRAGKRADAEPLLRTAREQYAAFGADILVERCDRELQAAGARSSRGARGPAELTAQEQAVVALVAAGMSNREAADELFLSTKTVQYHLTRIYAKLGVRSRTELAAQLRES